MPDVRLWPTNEEKLQRASAELSMSINEIVNLILDAVKELELKQTVAVAMKLPRSGQAGTDGDPPPPRRHVKRSHRIFRL